MGTFFEHDKHRQFAAGSATPFDLRNRRLNYAYSDFDRRHVFQATYVYELPFGEGKWLSSGNRTVNYIVGGWQLSGTTIWQSGWPSRSIRVRTP